MSPVTRTAGPLCVALAIGALAVGLMAVGGLGAPVPAAAPLSPSGAPSAAPSTASRPTPEPPAIVSAPLDRLAAGAHPEEVGGLQQEEGEKEPQMPPLAGAPGIDPVVQRSKPAGSVAAPAAQVAAASTSWAALGAGFKGPSGTMAVSMNPPDTSIGVGLDQIVEMVNFELAVFNKATGSVLVGPVSPMTLFSGFGGDCSTDEEGDGVVLYDRAADRWVLSWFAGYKRRPSGPYLQCVAVSTTPSATGTWARYTFSYSRFNDYPKLSVWGDSYIVTYNMFDLGSGTPYKGPQVCAYDRASMLAGTAIRAQQCFGPLATTYGSLLAATVDSFDGPPTGAPVPIVGLADTSHLGSWRLSIDWTTPANSSLSSVTLLAVPPFTPACDGDPNGACIVQPGTGVQVWSLGARVMQRLAYRNDAGVERLALTHSVGGPGASQIRWYELALAADRSVGVLNKGTYAPSAGYRWMGSAARDGAGNLALGYSLSSSTIYPSIAIAGRLATDPADTLGQSERVVVAGGGSQNGTSTRWGDYTTMVIDPADDCTFWYAGQYYPASHGYNWRTRILSFAYPSCVPSRLATLTIAGDGKGSIASDVAGMACVASCRSVWPNGTVVTLTPHWDAGNVFEGWSGACSGTTTCQLTMSAARSVTAQFMVDVTPPSVVIKRPAAATNAPVLTFALTFTEIVSGLDQGDLALSASTTATACAIGSPTGSGASWAVDVTGCSEGIVGLVLAANSVVDRVALLGPMAPAVSGDVLVDRTAPTVTAAPAVTLRIGGTLPSASTASPVPLRVTWAGADAGGSGIGHYLLERSIDGGSSWAVVAASVAGVSAAVTAAPSGTVLYRVTAFDAAGNPSAPTAGRAASPRLIQQHSTAIRYASSWYRLTSLSRSGGSDKWSRVRGASATLTTTARSVAVVVMRGVGRGTARIYVSGHYVATVNLYRSASQARYVVWSRDWGVAAKRVVKIVVTPSSRGSRVDLDGFVVLR